jgi:hypothetical protein
MTPEALARWACLTACLGDTELVSRSAERGPASSVLTHSAHQSWWSGLRVL